MEDISLILILGLDIAGQTSILFITINTCNSIPNLLNAIEKFQEAGFNKPPEVIISNQPEVFDAFRSKYENSNISF